ncbi:hypothetical protein EDB89DRAFT_1994416, partial [Lactarius sanguifluus]
SWDKSMLRVNASIFVRVMIVAPSCIYMPHWLPLRRNRAIVLPRPLSRTQCLYHCEVQSVSDSDRLPLRRPGSFYGSLCQYIAGCLLQTLYGTVCSFPMHRAKNGTGCDAEVGCNRNVFRALQPLYASPVFPSPSSVSRQQADHVCAIPVEPHNQSDVAG